MAEVKKPNTLPELADEYAKQTFGQAAGPAFGDLPSGYLACEQDFIAGARAGLELAAQLCDREGAAFERLRQTAVFQDSFEDKMNMCTELRDSIRALKGGEVEA